MRQTKLRRGAAACLLASLLACADPPTAPAALRGTYRLRAVGSTPLPALATDGMAGSVTVLAASLRFDGDSVRLERTERWVERGAGGVVLRSAERVRSERYPYSVSGGRLLIGKPCPPDPAILCAYSEAGMVEGSRLAMRVWYSQQPWSYERAED
ncbi:MAG TPA: hypothetical protein VFQ76_18460 [Longimicrobiaceae bacterium]|nr:hypothetical protein [Longimicrobiaceae bacterium]